MTGKDHKLSKIYFIYYIIYNYEFFFARVCIYYIIKSMGKKYFYEKHSIVFSYFFNIKLSTPIIFITCK